MRKVGLASLVIALVPLLAHAADKKEFVKAVRAAYYNATDKGLASFACDVNPDWSLILADQKVTDPVKLQKTLDALKDIRFHVNVGPKGATQFTHSITNTADIRMNDAYTKIYSGMGQMVQGFFQTWTQLVFAPPLPDPALDYELIQDPQGYHIRYTEGGSKVTTIIANDYSLSSLLVKNDQVSATLNPSFEHLPSGLLLSSFKTNFESVQYGVGDLDATFTYQEVDGFELPKILNVAGSLGGSAPYHMKVEFVGCKVEKAKSPSEPPPPPAQLGS